MTSTVPRVAAQALAVSAATAATASTDTVALHVDTVAQLRAAGLDPDAVLDVVLRALPRTSPAEST